MALLLRALLLIAIALDGVCTVEIPSVENLVNSILAIDSDYVHCCSNATNPTVATIAASPRAVAPAVAHDLVRRQSAYWYENIPHQGVAPWAPAGYQVYRNVKDFGAMGNGVTDDTAAINAAMAAGGRCGQGCASTTTTPAVIYFPAGTYLISSSIVDYYYTQLLGDATNPPVLKATSGFSGFGLIDGDKYYSPNLNWASTNVFFRQVRNFVLDLTAIPAASAATGIHWPTAQATSLQNIVFQMSAAAGTQHVGLFVESGSGGFMTDLTFNGGAVGAKIGNQQFSMRNMVFNNCVTAIYQLWSWGWVYQGITISNCQKGFDLSAVNPSGGALYVGSVTIIDSAISNTPVGIVTAFSASSQPATAGSLILENVVLTNVGTAVQYSGNGATVLPGGSMTIAGWGEGNKYTPNGPVRFQGAITPPPRPASLLTGSKYYVRTKPQYESFPASAFVSVRSAGATGNGATDDTTALQSIINSATAAGKIVFFDAGTYRVTQTLSVPPGAKLVGELLSSVIMSSGTHFSDMNNPKPVVQVGAAGQTGQVEWSDMLVSTQGAQAGAVLIEWNLATTGGTPSGMWDVHVRIGGFTGSQLQTAQCAKAPSNTAVNPACIAAFMSMHVTPSASGLYMENNWIWTADHDIDDPNLTQLTIYAGRGLYIESTAGTFWLSGTGTEHHVLYQYQLANTQNIFMGFIQTETPYFQPNPIAPAPFTVMASLRDPNFSKSCVGQTGNCAEAWGLRIIDSHDVLVYGVGLYSFFNNYDLTCSNNPGSENCQNQIFSVEGSVSNIRTYCLSTVGTTNMVVQDGAVLAKYSDNINVYPDTIALFQAAVTSSSNKWAPLGCYTDSVSARTLSNYFVVPGGQSATTIDSCLAVCHAAGYSLAGVEYGGECYCDNALRNGGGPAPDGSAQCNMPCNGNNAQACGGPNRLDMYEFPISSSNNWAALGCYTDVVAARTLSVRISSVPAQSMTIEACQAACGAAGYIYAGLEYASECYCDNALRNGGGPAPDISAKCNMACLGNHAETCGGPSRLDLYQSATLGFLGCFTDVAAARSLAVRIPGPSVPAQSMTIEKCQGACVALGYSFAGVEYASECYCDSALRNGGAPAPGGSTQCNMACLGNGGEICGGPNRLDLYYVTSTTSAARKWVSVGCFSDQIGARTLSQQMVLPGGSSSNTVEVCTSLCRAAGYMLAGVEFSSECYCDSKISNNGPAPDGSALCDMACSGNSGEICGGPNRVNVYQFA